MNVRIPLITFISIAPFFCLSQNGKIKGGTIHGHILTVDGQGAPYVTVVIKQTALGTNTDENGAFEIKKINPGVYTLNVSLSGYIDSSINIEIKQNDTLFLQLRLRENFADLKTIIVAARSALNYIETKTSASTKLNLPLLEVPQNIEVTTHQLLSDQGLLSMSEAMRTVSGVTKTAGGLNDYNPLIRGSDATWAIFRNGVGGYWWNQQEDAAMLEKIEFIKGPAGFMISVAQPGGIINNITKQPVTEQVANIGLTYGSYNLMRATIDAGGAIDRHEKLSYRFNAGVHNQDRVFQFSHAYRIFLCGAIRYDPDTNTSITAEYNNMRGRTSGNNTDLPSIGGKLFALPRNFALADASSDELNTIDTYYRLQVKHNFNENWHLYVQTAYVYGKWGGFMLNTDDNLPVSNDTLYRDANYDNDRNFAFSAQTYIDGHFFTGNKVEHKILAGIDYDYAGYNDALGGTWGEQKFGLNLAQPRYYVNPNSLRAFQITPTTTLRWGWSSLYVQDHIKVAGKLVITLGSHFTHAPLYFADPNVPDYQRTTRSNVFCPRAGLTWLFSENVSVYTLYDQSFWAEQGKNVLNKPFVPLTGYDLEAGVKSYFLKKKLLLNFSVYNIVKNHTVTADPLNYGYFIQQGQVICKGIDFDLVGNITPALTINANYSYTDAAITKDVDPNMIGMKNFGTPDQYGNLWVKYTKLHGRLRNISFAVGLQHMGERNAEVNWIPGAQIHFLPVYNLIDAALSCHNERFTIGLNVYNIANIDYAALGSFNSETNEWRYTPGEPINFRLSFGVSLIRCKK